MMNTLDPHPWPFFSSPWPTLSVLAAYLLFVLKVGPRFMEQRQPFDLRGLIKVYNIIQIVYNSVLFILAFHFVCTVYDVRCPISLPSEHESKSRERFLSNMYCTNKFIDLLETVFFVLRKKNRQISFLHVFHHVVVILAAYLTKTFYGHGGIASWMVVLNLFVHAFMYTYYLLSSVSTAVQKSLWWKKYITMIQLVQFALIMIHLIDVMMQPDCRAPRTVVYSFGILYAALTMMFAKFYIKTYLMPSRKKDT